MKRLTLIRERQDSAALPNDLRGLGASPLLIELPPSPYLVVEGANLPILEPVEKLFALQLIPQDGVLVLDSAVTESYKHKALRLWFAARHLLNRHPQLKLQIGEHDLLRETLLANIGQTEFVHPSRQSRERVSIQLHGQGTLGLSVLMQHVLLQVGYPLQVSEQDLVLKAADEIFRFELPAMMRKSIAV